MYILALVIYAALAYSLVKFSDSIGKEKRQNRILRQRLASIQSGILIPSEIQANKAIRRTLGDFIFQSPSRSFK